jgi:hypothetical protein
MHPCPGPAVTLTAAAKNPKPQLGDLITELLQTLHVARNGMIIQPSLHHASQPAADRSKGPMSALLKVCLDRRQRGPHALRHAFAVDREPAMTPGHAATVSEAEKIERFRATFSASLVTVDREATEFDHASLLVMELQAKFGKAFPKSLQARLGLVLLLEANDESSSPGEFQPQALTVPDVNLSAHPAPTQPDIVDYADELAWGQLTAEDTCLLYRLKASGIPSGPGGGSFVSRRSDSAQHYLFLIRSGSTEDACPFR